MIVLTKLWSEQQKVAKNQLYVGTHYTGEQVHTDLIYVRAAQSIFFFLFISFMPTKRKAKKMYVEMSDWEKVKAKTIFIKTFFGKGVLSQFS